MRHAAAVAAAASVTAVAAAASVAVSRAAVIAVVSTATEVEHPGTYYVRIRGGPRL